MWLAALGYRYWLGRVRGNELLSSRCGSGHGSEIRNLRRLIRGEEVGDPGFVFPQPPFEFGIAAVDEDPFTGGCGVHDGCSSGSTSLIADAVRLATSHLSRAAATNSSSTNTRQPMPGCDINASMPLSIMLMDRYYIGKPNRWRGKVVSGDWTDLDQSDAPVDPGFDFSVYDGAFLSAERTLRQQLAAGDPPPAGLTPDDLRAMIDATRAEPPKPDVVA